MSIMNKKETPTTNQRKETAGKFNESIGKKYSKL